MARLGKSAPARTEHVGDGDELLPRAALPRPSRLGRLDPLPVAEGDDVAAAAIEQAVEPGAALLAAAPRAEIGCDPLGHLIAVRPVGADGAGGAGPPPADAIESVANHPVRIGEAAAILLIGDPLDRRRLVADAADHQAAVDLIDLP